jgi:hypothetical protein
LIEFLFESIALLSEHVVLLCSAKS